MGIGTRVFTKGIVVTVDGEINQRYVVYNIPRNKKGVLIVASDFTVIEWMMPKSGHRRARVLRKGELFDRKESRSVVDGFKNESDSIMFRSGLKWIILAEEWFRAQT